MVVYLGYSMFDVLGKEVVLRGLLLFCGVTGLLVANPKSVKEPRQGSYCGPPRRTKRRPTFLKGPETELPGFFWLKVRHKP